MGEEKTIQDKEGRRKNKESNPKGFLQTLMRQLHVKSFKPKRVQVRHKDLRRYKTCKS